MKKKKVHFHQDNTLCHKSITTMAKLHELHFELLPHPPYFPDMAPSNYWLFTDHKRMFQGKRFKLLFYKLGRGLIEWCVTKKKKKKKKKKRPLTELKNFKTINSNETGTDI